LVLVIFLYQFLRRQYVQPIGTFILLPAHNCAKRAPRQNHDKITGTMSTNDNGKKNNPPRGSNTLDDSTRRRTCSDFGGRLERKKLHPLAFFCSPCDLYDLQKEGGGNGQRNSRRHKCVADHGPNWFAPSNLNEEWHGNTIREVVCGKTKRVEEQGEVTRGEESSSSLDASPKKRRTRTRRTKKEPLNKVNVRLRCMMANLNKKLEAQDRAIEALKEEKKKIQRKAAYWKDLKEENDAQEKTSEAKPDTLCEGIIDAINNVVQKHFSKYGQRRIGKEIAKAVWSTDLCRGVARKTLRNLTYKELKEKVFSPHRILKFMDLSSGSLNYAAIDILRAIENLTGEKWFRGIIPSPATLRRCARKVEALADEIIPIEKFLSPQGEGIKFAEMGKVLEIIHKAF
jgi:hypothetical protein